MPLMSNTLESRISERLKFYEERNDARRDTKFEFEQVSKLFQGKYTIDVMDPTLAMRVKFKPRKTSEFSYINPRDKNRVVVNKHAFTFKTKGQMMLWLYRRAETALKINRPIASTILGLATRIDDEFVPTVGIQ